jgi:hypothetical protein
MASKSSSPGPNPTTNPPSKQARSRKAATQNATTGRAASGGGIVLEKEKEVKTKSTSVPKPTASQNAVADTSNNTPRRKPRKLNKDPTPVPAPVTTTTKTKAASSAEPPTATEIEALKSRVRGLEAKVEELYKTGSLDRPGRSPRRRGKGRKGSSQQQVPTLSTSKAKATEEDDDIEEIGRGDNADSAVEEEEGVEELVRLEGELEVARQDLAAFRPRKGRATSTLDDDDVEDIPRESTTSGTTNGRHVTLSGSYRIPLPASVSVDDVKHIQSGVSAAQNVARSFLEQRRAANSVASSASPSAPQAKKPARPAPKSVSSSMEIVPAEAEGGKKSWSEWIGGYSVAISRAVQSIEHEAAVESTHGSGTRGGGGTARKSTGGGVGASGKKRPGVKTKMSGEQVDGLMS